MKNFISKIINGAFPQPEIEAMPPEDEYYPEDGIVIVPEFYESNPVPGSGLDDGPVCTLIVSVGNKVFGGFPLAEIETPSHIVEIPSPCSGVIIETYVESGQTVKAGQPLVKIQKP